MNLIVAGAGGHAREIRDILDMQGVNEVWFFDNISKSLPTEMVDENLICDEVLLKQKLEQSPAFILGTGVPSVRIVLYNLFLKLGGEPQTCVANTAILSQRAVEIGEGCNIMHRVLINNQVKIGKGTLINAGVHLHHDVCLGDFCEIGPGAILLGKVKIGDSVIVGGGAIILPNINIADGAVIGAGAVVTKNVESGKTVKGNPAM